MKSLEDLRTRLDVLDRQLLEIVAERQALGAQIDAVKRTTGQSTRDFGRERGLVPTVPEPEPAPEAAGHAGG